MRVSVSQAPVFLMVPDTHMSLSRGFMQMIADIPEHYICSVIMTDWLMIIPPFSNVLLSMHSFGFMEENCSGRVSSFSSLDLYEKKFVFQNFWFSYPAVTELSVLSDDSLSELDCSHNMNITGTIKNIVLGIFLFILIHSAPLIAEVTRRETSSHVKLSTRREDFVTWEVKYRTGGLQTWRHFVQQTLINIIFKQGLHLFFFSSLKPKGTALSAITSKSVL